MADTAWAYLVVSSGVQQETLRDQESWSRACAAEHEWEITRVFEGVSSGRDGARKLLGTLLTELRATPKASRPDRVLMIRIDRLGRGDGIEAVAALAEIRRLGVAIHTRQDGDVRIDRASDAILPMLRSITGALENESRAEKSRAMHERKRAAHEVQGLPPYGFIVVDRRLAVYAPEAAFVRELFGLRARGWSYGRLSMHARANAPRKRRKNGSLDALRWAPSTLAVILHNVEYRGEIVDVDLFDEVARRSRPIIPNDARHPWPLRGALRCTCGLRVTGRMSGGVGGKYRSRYYVCYDAAAHGGYPGHRADEIEAQFVELLDRLRAEPQLAASYAATEDVEDEAALRSQRAALERECESIGARRDKVWRLAESDTIPADEIARRLDELRAEQTRARDAIAEIDRRMDRARAAKRMYDGVADALLGAAEFWVDAPTSVQVEIANAIAALVGGLWVDATRKGVLLIGPAHGEVRRKADNDIAKKFIQSIAE